MVASADQVIEIIKKYVRELENHNIPVQEVILFGSYAGENPRVRAILIWPSSLRSSPKTVLRTGDGSYRFAEKSTAGLNLSPLRPPDLPKGEFWPMK